MKYILATIQADTTTRNLIEISQYINDTNHAPTESIEDVIKDVIEIVGEIEELINGKAYELTEDDLFNLTIPEVAQTSDEEDTEQDGHKVIFKKKRIQKQVCVSDGEKLEERFTSDNIAKGLRKFKSAMSYFLHIDPSVERSLHVKGLMDDALSIYSNILEGMKKKESQEKRHEEAGPSMSSNVIENEEEAFSSLFIKTEVESDLSPALVVEYNKIQ
ncbi:hypothetical protein QE152_g10533 [Popillia japonica]|uniref:Uncharacterized protein n=1 Tax=Popillia japonica TaxID=7064 RepID=A0AAW1LTG3_POPJA